MPFARPTLSTLITRIETDIQSRLGGSGGVLRRSVVAVIARVMAGIAHGLYGFLDYLSRQFLGDTAESEWLERHAAEFDIARKAAAQSGGPVTFSGSDGAVIPAGTTLVRNDGAEFTADASGTIDGGTVEINVTAAEAGRDGNTSSGVTLSLASPLNSVDSEATVAGDGLTGGSEEESDDDLRARLLQRMRNTPQGGATPDYERWALEVPGVTRAWPLPLNRGLGTVDLTFVRDEDDPIIPSAAEVSEVQDYIDERRPTTPDFQAFAPTAVALDFTIALTPDTVEVREAVEAELRDMITRDAEPGGTILHSRIREAISIAAGETDHDLVAPTADVTHGTGELAVFGSITWQ